MATKKKDNLVPDAVEAIKPDAVKNPVMYLGPAIPRMGLKTNQLYRDGIPERFNKEPIKRLFAEPLKINDVKASIKKAGTAANLAYTDMLNRLSEME
ncbi:MAG: hypothetical protein MR853_05035 [Selenomonadales bacterium]|nr:hypothetical protein [Selenomonadales bacterium]